MNELPKNDIEFSFTLERILSALINAFGASLTFIYLNVIDPTLLLKAKSSFRGLNGISGFVFVGIFVSFFFVGIGWGNYLKKGYRRWASRIERGEVIATDVPVQVKRDVLNFPLYASLIALLMWSSASLLAGYLTSSVDVSFSLLVWGGGVSAVLLYFANDLIWKPVIRFFFPKGDLNKVRAFSLPVFIKLLGAFLLVGVLPPALLVFLSLQKVDGLLSASNPDVLVASLYNIEFYILGASVSAAIVFAFFITRGIVAPLTDIKNAMGAVQEGELDASVSVTTNDEIGYLGIRFNEMTVELREKERVKGMNALLKEQLLEISALETALREQATIDPLTELFNRRYMKEALEKEVLRSIRLEQPFSVALIDLDNLKVINDRYGHVYGGDAALVSLSRTISFLTREEDVFCRYAGDEFLMILYNTSSVVAYERAHAWKNALSQVKIPAQDTFFSITFSAGIAEFPLHGADAETLTKNADKALYLAKKAGRNCVKICEANPLV